jgi:hypothetical protein
MERLRYQTQLAERQFMRSDPDNRLVTGELERRWEQSLRELKAAEVQLEQEERQAPNYAIPADLLELLKDVGARLPELWNSGLLKTSQKKALLRSLIDKVVIHRLADDQVQTRVVWKGGVIRGVRLRKRILHRVHQSHPRRVPGFLTIPQLADKLGISRCWIQDRIRSGTIKAVKDPRANCYLFPDTPETLAELTTIISTFQTNSGRRRGHQDA